MGAQREDRMANETDNAEDAAGRLELALERIAGLSARGVSPAPKGEASVPAAELAVRLDRVIDRLRAALDGTV